jgi:hypothetical protein
MTEHQRLFLVQARSNLAIFEFLRSNAHLPVCHALHYLQMATEMLGKAYLWRHGQQKNSHRALVKFLKALETNRSAQNQLDFGGQNEFWRQRIRKAKILAEMIENLAPALADGPNPEYPWPPENPTICPAEHNFEIWETLQTGSGRSFLDFIRKLFENADQFL